MLRDKRNLQAKKWAAVVEGVTLHAKEKLKRRQRRLAICFLLIV